MIVIWSICAVLTLAGIVAAALIVRNLNKEEGYAPRHSHATSKVLEIEAHSQDNETVTGW